MEAAAVERGAGKVCRLDASTTGDRWLSVGSSAALDSTRAGEEAAGRALGRHDDPCLLMVFCSATRDPHQVLAGINVASGGVPVIGCSSSAVIAPEGPSPEGIVAVALEEHPITGTPPDATLMPASTWCGSRVAEQNTMSRHGSSWRPSARPAASSPARVLSSAAELPTESQRSPVVDASSLQTLPAPRSTAAASMAQQSSPRRATPQVPSDKSSGKSSYDPDGRAVDYGRFRVAETPQSGMLPCFLGGSVSRLVRSVRRPRTTWARVADGGITASTYPRSAAM